MCTIKVANQRIDVLNGYSLMASMFEEWDKDTIAGVVQTDRHTDIIGESSHYMVSVDTQSRERTAASV